MSLSPITLGSLESWEYFASWGDLRGWALADGVLNSADSANAVWHYNTYAEAEHRSILFDAWEYLASNVDLMTWLTSDGLTAADAITAAKHYLQYGVNEGRTITFDSAAYLAANADLQHWIIDILHLSGDAANDFAAQHYITFGRFEAGRPDGSNHAPVAHNVAATGLEDAASITVNPSSTDVDAHDTAIYSVTTQPLHGTVSVVGSSFAYVPVANFNGTDSFTYTVTDHAGLTSVAIATITVTPVNDIPVVSNLTGSGLEDQQVIGQVTGTDVDGSALTYSIVANGAHGAVSLNAGTGVYTYTPTANYNGTDTFTYKANDGTADSATATVTLTINAVNDAPVAQNLVATVAEDASVTVTALSTDVDAADTATYLVNSQPTHGTVALNGAGTGFIYTPNANYNGTDSFTYKVTDAAGASSVATASITVTAVNDAPVAGTFTGSGLEDHAITGQVSGTDIEGSTLTYSIVTNGAHGAVSLDATTGAYTYTPNANYNGTDTFTYKANDSTVDSASETVTLTVTSVNDAPLFASATQTISIPESTTTAATIVTAAATDVDLVDATPDSLTYTLTGADSAKFAIDSTTGAVTLAAPLNFENPC